MPGPSDETLTTGKDDRMSRPYRRFALAALLVLSAGAAPADDPVKTRKLTAEELSFEVPEAWKSGPTSQFRKVQLEIAPAQGDKEPAVLALFIFGGGAGTVQANVERWRSQFKDADGDKPEVEQVKVKGQN